MKLKVISLFAPDVITDDPRIVAGLTVAIEPPTVGQSLGAQALSPEYIDNTPFVILPLILIVIDFISLFSVGVNRMTIRPKSKMAYPAEALLNDDEVCDNAFLKK